MWRSAFVASMRCRYASSSLDCTGPDDPAIWPAAAPYLAGLSPLMFYEGSWRVGTDQLPEWHQQGVQQREVGAAERQCAAQLPQRTKTKTARTTKHNQKHYNPRTHQPKKMTKQPKHNNCPQKTNQTTHAITGTGAVSMQLPPK